MGEPNERLIGGCLPAQCHHVPPFVSLCSVSAAGSFEVDGELQGLVPSASENFASQRSPKGHGT